MDEIFLQGNNKVSDEEEAHENIESDFDEKDIYQVDNTNLDDKKENIEWRKRTFESELENTYEIEIQNSMTCIDGNKSNKWSDCNLKHHILNYNKCNKHLNFHCYSIIQGCMNMTGSRPRRPLFYTPYNLKELHSFKSIISTNIFEIFIFK